VRGARCAGGVVGRAGGCVARTKAAPEEDAKSRAAAARDARSPEQRDRGSDGRHHGLDGPPSARPVGVRGFTVHTRHNVVNQRDTVLRSGTQEVCDGGSPRDSQTNKSSPFRNSSLDISLRGSSLHVCHSELQQPVGPRRRP
jgi:hypothetical protein